MKFSFASERHWQPQRSSFGPGRGPPPACRRRTPRWDSESGPGTAGGTQRPERPRPRQIGDGDGGASLSPGPMRSLVHSGSDRWSWEPATECHSGPGGDSADLITLTVRVRVAGAAVVNDVIGHCRPSSKGGVQVHQLGDFGIMGPNLGGNPGGTSETSTVTRRPPLPVGYSQHSSRVPDSDFSKLGTGTGSRASPIPDNLKSLTGTVTGERPSDGVPAAGQIGDDFRSRVPSPSPG